MCICNEAVNDVDSPIRIVQSGSVDGYVISSVSQAHLNPDLSTISHYQVDIVEDDGDRKAYSLSP